MCFADVPPYTCQKEGKRRKRKILFSWCVRDFHGNMQTAVNRVQCGYRWWTQIYLWVTRDGPYILLAMQIKFSYISITYRVSQIFWGFWSTIWRHEPEIFEKYSTVPFRSIRAAPWPVTHQPKFCFRSSPKLSVTSHPNGAAGPENCFIWTMHQQEFSDTS